jgi:hypothetical protein
LLRFRILILTLMGIPSASDWGLDFILEALGFMRLPFTLPIGAHDITGIGDIAGNFPERETWSNSFIVNSATPAQINHFVDKLPTAT